MPSMIRRLEKRMLKKVGFRREPATKWEIGADGRPFMRTLKKHERKIENVLTGRIYGPYYPHVRDRRHAGA